MGVVDPSNFPSVSELYLGTDGYYPSHPAVCMPMLRVFALAFPFPFITKLGYSTNANQHCYGLFMIFCETDSSHVPMWSLLHTLGRTSFNRITHDENVLAQKLMDLFSAQMKLGHPITTLLSYPAYELRSFAWADGLREVVQFGEYADDFPNPFPTW